MAAVLALVLVPGFFFMGITAKMAIDGGGPWDAVPFLFSTTVIIGAVVTLLRLVTDMENESDETKADAEVFAFPPSAATDEIKQAA